MKIISINPFSVLIVISIVANAVFASFIEVPPGFRLKRDTSAAQRRRRLETWCRARRIDIDQDPTGCLNTLREFCQRTKSRNINCRSGSEPAVRDSAVGNNNGRKRPVRADRSAIQGINNLGNQIVGGLAQRFLSGLLGDSSAAPVGPPRDPSRIQRDAFQNEADVNSHQNLLDSMFETDVDLTVGQAKFIKSLFQGFVGTLFGNGKRRKKRKIGSGTDFQLWERIPIPYEFDRTVSTRSRGIIKQAIRLWEQNTCVRWQENGPGTDRVEFTRGQGCSSYVGRTGGTQPISLYEPGCDQVGIASHEIGHSLGFFHEQNRPDQDQFVTINYRNIYPTYYNNFVKRSRNDVNDYGVPYDYGSVMHYDGFVKAFTVSDRSYAIVARNKEYQQTMGQRNEPSFVDFKQVNLAYCADECRNSPSCQHGGYPDPNNCKQCKCPSGFGGKTCATVEASDSGCGGILQATRTPKTVGGRLSRGKVCNYLLQAPQGYRVQMRFRSLSAACTEPCGTDFVEVKTGELRWEITGFRVCCRTPPTSTFVSNGNQIVLRAVAQSGSPSFSVEYWSDAPGGGGGSGGGTAATVAPRTAPPRVITEAPRIENTYAPVDEDDCECSRWSNWSGCDNNCGGCGFQRRERTCPRKSKRKCHNVEKKRCNFQSCGDHLNGPSFGGGKIKLFYQGCCVPLVPSGGVCGGFSNILDKIFQLG